MTHIKNTSKTNLFILFLLAITIAQSCTQSTKDERLPLLGRREVITKTEDGKSIVDTVYHTVSDFVFVDQDSALVSNETYDGKIYIADFFFTTCPSICPVMHTQMLRIYEQFKDEDQLAMLSYSIDPVHDSVAVLKDYAERLGVEDVDKWHFVTGDKDKIYDLGENGYMVVAGEDPKAPGGYVHSGALILVDKDRHIRGFYDGTKPEKVDQLLLDIPKLLKEYQGNGE